MPKVLITGASGFIGSFLVEEALNQNFEVYAGIRKTSSKQFLKDERIHFFETQLNNKKNTRSRGDLNPETIFWALFSAASLT